MNPALLIPDLQQGFSPSPALVRAIAATVHLMLCARHPLEH